MTSDMTDFYGPDLPITDKDLDTLRIWPDRIVKRCGEVWVKELRGMLRDKWEYTIKGGFLG